MKIGVLQTGFVPPSLESEHGQYPEMFERLLDGHGFELLAMHQDQVVQTPTEARRIASSDFCLNAGLAYEGRNGTKGVSYQPHPEFSPRYIRDLIALKCGVQLPDQQATTALAGLTEDNDSAFLADQLSQFYNAHAMAVTSR